MLKCWNRDTIVNIVSIMEKEVFIKMMQERTKKFAVDIIKLCDTFDKSSSSSIVSYQLIKSATSTGANYRAACKARSKAEFFSKICIVAEESDESEYWLEIIEDTNLTQNLVEIKRLKMEANEITKIISKAKNSSYPVKK